MACFRILFDSPDAFNEMNGPHLPVASGAEFLAKYGDGLTVDGDDLSASMIDALPVYGVLKIEGDFGEVLTVDRVS